MATVAKSMLDATVKGFLRNMKSKRHFVSFQLKRHKRLFPELVLTKLKHLFGG
jgi:hypothetical protein